MFHIELVPTTKRGPIFCDSGAEEIFFSRLCQCSELIEDYGFAFATEVGATRDVIGAYNFVFAAPGIPTNIADAANQESFLLDLDYQLGNHIKFEPIEGEYMAFYKDESERVGTETVVRQLVQILDRFRTIVELADPSLSKSEVFKCWLSIDEYHQLTKLPFEFVHYDGDVGDLFDEPVPKFEKGYNFFQRQLSFVAGRLAESVDGLVLEPLEIRGYRGTFEHGETTYVVNLDTEVYGLREDDFGVLVEIDDRSHFFGGGFDSVVSDWQSGWKEALAILSGSRVSDSGD